MHTFYVKKINLLEVLDFLPQIKRQAESSAAATRDRIRATLNADRRERRQCISERKMGNALSADKNE